MVSTLLFVQVEALKGQLLKTQHSFEQDKAQFEQQLEVTCRAELLE